MLITGFLRCSVLLLASSVLLTNCKKACDNENAPTFGLTQGQQEWSKPFAKNTVWRFRNATGYVRTYRITRAEVLNEGGGGGKSSLCATYFVNFFVATVERTDSVARPLENTFRFQMDPTNTSTNVPFRGFLQMGGDAFTLPIDQVEDGRLTLAPATFGGRTYPAALESYFYPTPPLVPRPTQTGYVCLTKAEGLVRFEELGGTVWNRL